MRTGAMQKGYSVEARGQFGYSGGFGRLKFDYNRFGFYHFLCGIYKKKYLWGKSYISKMQFYRPTNPRTVLQQEWRSVCAYAWVLWALVDINTRKLWKIQAQKKHITGPNLFMSRWLSSPSGGFGNLYF